MKPMKRRLVLAIAAAGIITAGTAQTPPSPDQIVASLKQNLAESQKRLRTYEWIETTAISLKGEEKSRKQQRVYYGADGRLTKTAIGAAPAAPPPQSSGRRGGGRLKERIVENKKDEMQEYMERADGTSYSSQTTLDAAAKNIRVVVQNAGHRPLAR